MQVVLPFVRQTCTGVLSLHAPFETVQLSEIITEQLINSEMGII